MVLFPLLLLLPGHVVLVEVLVKVLVMYLYCLVRQDAVPQHNCENISNCIFLSSFSEEVQTLVTNFLFYQQITGVFYLACRFKD